MLAKPVQLDSDVAPSDSAILSSTERMFGDIAAFSTMFGKHMATGSQGGVVYTQNEELH